MSNYFSESQIDLLAKAKSEKKYIHVKNENENLKEVMNIKNLNKLISMHNCWDQKNFFLVLNKNTIPFSKFLTSGNVWTSIFVCSLTIFKNKNENVTE